MKIIGIGNYPLYIYIYIHLLERIPSAGIRGIPEILKIGILSVDDNWQLTIGS